MNEIQRVVEHMAPEEALSEISEGNFRYPTGRAGLEAQKYNHEFLRVLPERVLKTNGKLMIADQILTDESPSDTRSMVDKWAG